MNSEKSLQDESGAQELTQAEKILGSEPPFDEHMKDIRGEGEVHTDVGSKEVQRAKEEIDRRLGNGENYTSIMDSFSPDLQKQLYASWLNESSAPANPPIEEDDFKKIEEENRRSHDGDLDASARAEIFKNGDY